MSGDWLGIAFRSGQLGNPKDDLIMAATFGPWVHCEVIRGQGERGWAYGAFEDLGGFMSSENIQSPPEWGMFAVPVKDAKALQGLLLHLISLELPYNTHDLWQCCVTAFLPWETELDCEHPESWKPHGLFCSQAALLILRRLAHEKAIELPGDLRELVEASHSRGCSPNALFGLLARGNQIARVY